MKSLLNTYLNEIKHDYDAFYIENKYGKNTHDKQFNELKKYFKNDELSLKAINWIQHQYDCYYIDKLEKDNAFLHLEKILKMITHEEIIKDLESFYHLYGSNEVLRKFRKYALEQQAKDKASQKEHELLGLYRKSAHYQIGYNLGCLSKDDRKDWIDVEKQIKALEKELEEMK